MLECNWRCFRWIPKSKKVQKSIKKPKKSIKNQKKSKQIELFLRFYTNFKVITVRKGKKVIMPKFGHYYFFQIYFHAYFFHVFYLNFFSKIQMIFATLMQDLYLPRHMACCCSIKKQFLRKNSNKSVKNQKREKSAKIWNKHFWKTITNSTTNYKLYLRLQIMILPEWQFRSDSWHENLFLKKCTGAHRPFKRYYPLETNYES